MFNLSGSELIFLVLIALVVLGPDKLPDAMRKAGKAYADFKRMTSGFQQEMKSVLDEPMRELRETAELAKKSAMWDVNQPTAPPPTGQQQNSQHKPVSANMADHEPSDAAKRRSERSKPPDLNISTTAPLVSAPQPPEVVDDDGTVEVIAAVDMGDAAPPLLTPNGDEHTVESVDPGEVASA